jgi:serine/threonine protein phosphatase 1
MSYGIPLTNIPSMQHIGEIVVHGHCITQVPELLPNRIGIDTGAYATGSSK